MYKRYRNKIPSLATGSDRTDRLISYLDAIDLEKKKSMDLGLRGYTPLIHANNKYLISRLRDMGFPEIPEDYPTVLLHQMAYCAGLINQWRGTIKGIILYLQACTLGEVILDVEDYFPPISYIAPSDKVRGRGYLPANPDSPVTGLINIGQQAGSGFEATIKTYFNDNPIVRDYVEATLKRYLPFFEGTQNPEINWVCGGMYPIDHMYPHINEVCFVNGFDDDSHCTLLDGGINENLSNFAEVDDGGENDSLSDHNVIDNPN